jgi:hypothetical protein
VTQIVTSRPVSTVFASCDGLPSESSDRPRPTPSALDSSSTVSEIKPSSSSSGEPVRTTSSTVLSTPQTSSSTEASETTETTSSETTTSEEEQTAADRLTSTSFQTFTKTSSRGPSNTLGANRESNSSAPAEKDTNYGVILGATLCVVSSAPNALADLHARGSVAGIFMLLLIARFLYRLANGGNKDTDSDSLFECVFLR